MYFLTDEFLGSLEAGGAGVESAITTVEVARKTRLFDLELISDYLVERPTEDSGEYTLDDIHRLREKLVDRVTNLRREFHVKRSEDPEDVPTLLVSCGDLVARRSGRSQAELRRAQTAYREICLPALRSLQATDARWVFAIPGDADAFGGGGEVRGVWEASPAVDFDTHPYYAHFARELAANGVPPRPEDHPVVQIFRVVEKPGQEEGSEQPLACIAVVGFDSNDVEYKYDLVTDSGQISQEQMERSRRLVSVLRTTVARSVPLYVIAVTHHNLLTVHDNVAHSSRGAEDEHYMRFMEVMGSSDVCTPASRFCVTNHFLAERSLGKTSNASGFLSHLVQLRASLVLHSNMHQRAATTVTTSPLIAGRPAQQLDVLSAPALSEGRPSSGMARIRLDLWKGEAEIAFKYDTSEDGGFGGKPVQVNRPLISASRVSTGERRLYGHVNDLIHKALDDDTVQDRSAVQHFADYVAEVWADHGYAPVSFADGTLPHDLGPASRRSRYYLLLLLREVEGGNYEMLLSRHNPLRASDVAEWDTLLMPAFSSVRNLMERLRLDVVRQIDLAEDLDLAADAKRLEEAVELIQGGGGNLQDDIWLDKVREVGKVTKRKISPTTGEISDYEYRLVVLTPFVREWPAALTADESQADDEEGEAESSERVELRAERIVVDWLRELPSVQPHGASITSRQQLPMEAIMPGGAGLRWDTIADSMDRDDVSDKDERRGRVYPPGSVWFPLAQAGDAQPWELAPSIVARNADVMCWVDEQLTDRRAKDGTYPPHLVLGKMRESTGYEVATGPFPFDGVPFAANPNSVSYMQSRDRPLAASTIEAMQRVEYIDQFDLAGQRPYADHVISRVVLVRRSIRVPSGRERDAICVFDASDRPAAQNLSSYKSKPVEHRLGLLRPTQRYVLKAGLERATWVNRFLGEQCGRDPWGFIRARYGGAGEPIALTPPIIEQVHSGDVDTDDPDLREFLLCDGNHRVVAKVWNLGEPAAAIAVKGEPKEPYYAYPFSPYEWRMTAANVLTVTPESWAKYAPREVVLETLSDEAQKLLKSVAPEVHFRRYYRDLPVGFGPIGGQGGLYV